MTSTVTRTSPYVPRIGWVEFTRQCLAAVPVEHHEDAAAVFAECCRAGVNPSKMFEAWCYWMNVAYYPNWLRCFEAKDWKSFRMNVLNELKHKPDAEVK